MHSRRRYALSLIVTLIGLAILTSCGGRGNQSAQNSAASSSFGSATTSPRDTSPRTISTGAPSGVGIPNETLVATITPAGARGSQTPGGPTTLTVPGQWYGASSVLPVLAQRPGWVEVRLAQRPNESVAWVPADDVSLASDPFYIVVNLSTTHLQLFDQGHEVENFPAGIGITSAPTPTGQFFVALFAQPPSPGYGEFVMVTSGHSNTISDWEQSGDAIVAIHGSLGSDGAIGITGARVSHGCIRLHDVDLLRLRDVPAGTPVDVLG